MGSCLGLVSVNIIMTALEPVIVDKLFAANLLKILYSLCRWHLSINKRIRYYIVLKKLNSFHPSLKFTTDKFDDGIEHYLDIKIVDNETNIYFKDTYTQVNTCIFLHMLHGV